MRAKSRRGLSTRFARPRHAIAHGSPIDSLHAKAGTRASITTTASTTYVDRVNMRVNIADDVPQRPFFTNSATTARQE